VAIVAGSYVWIVLGYVTSHAVQNTLVYWRAVHLVLLVMLLAGVLGVAAALRWAQRREPRLLLAPVAAIVAAVLAVALVSTYANDLRQSRSLALSHSTVLPDGSSPQYPPAHNARQRLFLGEGGGHGPVRRVEIANLTNAAPVSLLWRALGGSSTGDEVVLSTQPALEWYYPVYFFNGWTPSYAHTAGGYVQRLRFLRHLAHVSDPVVFLHRFQHNEFQRIDAAVLFRGRNGHLLYVTRVDHFGHGTGLTLVRFDAAQFPPSMWQLTDVGPYLVARPLPQA
jgi:hypothetical protein